MKQDAGATRKLCWLLPIFAFGSSLCSLGCGAPAAPLPPTLNLPQPVRDLAAGRVGDTVHLTFTVPEKTTDKLPVRGAMAAHLCRSVDSGPCQVTETGALALAAKTASLDDPLPPELSQGSPRLLTYTLTILNRAGKSAGDSTPAYSVAGAAPPPVTGLAVTPRRKGIVLSWQSVPAPSGGDEWLRFDRTRTSTASPQDAASSGTPFPGRNAKEEPAEQVLRVPEPPPGQSGIALDTTARTGNSYRYTAQRVEEVTLGKRALQLASLSSAAAATDYRDVFPPPTPVGLVSAADAAGKSIDLDWTPDVDPGLAGYIVYRRAAGSAETPQRISPAGKPVVLSAYSDTTAAPGRRYAYSVSAIDLSGNESARSPEVEDEWNPAGAASGPAAHPESP